MGKYVLIAQSAAKDGQDDEYNKWYGGTHLPDICAIPGVKSGRRFELAMVPHGHPGLRYLAIYEVEVDDPASVMAEIGKRMSNGTMKISEALDADPTVMWFYKLREE
jgi:hypothetical protein